MLAYTLVPKKKSQTPLKNTELFQPISRLIQVYIHIHIFKVMCATFDRCIFKQGKLTCIHRCTLGEVYLVERRGYCKHVIRGCVMTKKRLSKSRWPLTHSHLKQVSARPFQYSKRFCLKRNCRVRDKYCTSLSALYYQEASSISY